MNTDKDIVLNIQGMWIPGEVAFNPKLNLTDKMLFTTIDMLIDSEDGCSPNDVFFYKRLGRTEKTIQKSISRLVKYGYIKKSISKKRGRVLRINYNYIKKYAHLITEFNNKNRNKKRFNI